MNPLCGKALFRCAGLCKLWGQTTFPLSCLGRSKGAAGSPCLLFTSWFNQRTQTSCSEGLSTVSGAQTPIVTCPLTKWRVPGGYASHMPRHSRALIERTSTGFEPLTVQRLLAYTHLLPRLYTYHYVPSSFFWVAPHFEWIPKLLVFFAMKEDSPYRSSSCSLNSPYSAEREEARDSYTSLLQ